MTDDELIARHVELRPVRPWPAEARLVDSAVPIWSIIGYLKAMDWDVAEVAHEFDVPQEAIEAALAYYRRHQCFIDARLAENAATLA